MGLDYSNGCVNFRDVGEFVNIIAGRALVPEKRLYRGGKLDSVDCAEEIANPASIINLRRSADLKVFDAEIYHFPISDEFEKYDTTNRQVRRWLNEVLRVFELPSLRYPVLIHCTSGKDRTGVVVASILRVLDVPESVIVEEYLLSEGAVQPDWIRQSLDGIRETDHYFNRVDLSLVRAGVLGKPPLA
jgi:protein-tyrosine phosphatase